MLVLGAYFPFGIDEISFLKLKFEKWPFFSINFLYSYKKKTLAFCHISICGGLSRLTFLVVPGDGCLCIDDCSCIAPGDVH